MPPHSNEGSENNLTTIDSRRLAAAEQGNQQPTQRRKPRGITVPEEVIRPLNEHYQKLEGYIKGFLRFRELTQKSREIRAAVENHSRWQEKWTVLEDVRLGIESVQADLVMKEAWEEFAAQLADFGAALQEADAGLNGDGGLLSAADPTHEDARAVMLGPLSRMVKNAGQIEGMCRERSQDELDELGRYVKNMFEQLERRSVGETSGSNEPAAPPLVLKEEETKPAVEFQRTGSEESNVAGRSARRDVAHG